MQIVEIQTAMNEKDKLQQDTIKVSDEYRLKLQESFKEYLWMDQSMVILRREAQKGSQAADARNIMLQKSLEKLTNDFEVCAKDLSTSQATIRELEFELDTMVRQFNVLGESKKQVDDIYSKTTALLTKTETELDQLKKEHEQTLLLKSKNEADSRLAEIELQDNIKELEERVNNLNSQNGILSTKKAELESIVKANKFEMDKQNGNLKVIISQKNLLQTEMQAAAVNAEKEILARSMKINDLTEAKLADQKQLKKLQEVKETLMFQITDLKNNLDREMTTVKQLNFEINQSKRESEEKASIIEDQLDKLNSAKTNLTKDKAQLIEKLNTLRLEYKNKEQELNNTQAEFSIHREESGATIEQLQKTIEQLQLTKKSLEGFHKDLEMAHKNLQEQHKIQCEKNGVHCATEKLLKKDNRHLKSDLIESRNEGERLLRTLNASVELQASTKIKLEISLSQIENLTETLDSTKKEAIKIQRVLEVDNTTLTYRLTKSMKDNDSHAVTIARLQTNILGLDKDLGNTKESLAAEMQWRETLQHQLHENRLKYSQERTMRSEFERLHMKMRHQQRLLDVDQEANSKLCQIKLAHVASTMGTETSRLKELSSLLPHAMDFGNTTLPTGKEFEWLFGDNAFSRSVPNAKATSATRDKDRQRTYEEKDRSRLTHATRTVDGKPKKGTYEESFMVSRQRR